MISVTLADGSKVQVEAGAYMSELRREIEDLRATLTKQEDEKKEAMQQNLMAYIQALPEKEIKDLTANMSPEVYRGCPRKQTSLWFGLMPALFVGAGGHAEAGERHRAVDGAGKGRRTKHDDSAARQRHGAALHVATGHRLPPSRARGTVSDSCFMSLSFPPPPFPPLPPSPLAQARRKRAAQRSLSILFTLLSPRRFIGGLAPNGTAGDVPQPGEEMTFDFPLEEALRDSETKAMEHDGNADQGQKF
eukprot:scaffold1913_cov257-Pinguiococcus_pyrenoidosus.AAC.21